MALCHAREKTVKLGFLLHSMQQDYEQLIVCNQSLGQTWTGESSAITLQFLYYCVCCWHLPSVDSRTTSVMAINENMIVTAWNNTITTWLQKKRKWQCSRKQTWLEERKCGKYHLEEDGNACGGSHHPVLRDAHPSLLPFLLSLSFLSKHFLFSFPLLPSVLDSVAFLFLPFIQNIINCILTSPPHFLPVISNVFNPTILSVSHLIVYSSFNAFPFSWCVGVAPPWNWFSSCSNSCCHCQLRSVTSTASNLPPFAI